MTDSERTASLWSIADAFYEYGAGLVHGVRGLGSGTTGHVSALAARGFEVVAKARQR